MAVTLDISPELATQIEAAWGENVARAAKESLAAEGYRRGLLSLGQVAELIDVSTYEADGFLKALGLLGPLGPSDLDRDLAALRDAH